MKDVRVPEQLQRAMAAEAEAAREARAKVILIKDKDKDKDKEAAWEAKGKVILLVSDMFSHNW